MSCGVIDGVEVCSMNPTQELIASAQAGDRSAFDALVEHYRPRLEALIASRLGAELRAALTVDEVIQETLFQALRSLPRFEWRGADSFMRWLGAIAENAIRKAHRSMERGLKLEARLRQFVPKAPDDVSPSQALRREERFDRLEAALQRLRPEHRRVIMLSRIERLPIGEIARRLDRSEVAVKSLLARAIRELRVAFGTTESFGLPPRRLGAEEGTRHEE